MAKKVAAVTNSNGVLKGTKGNDVLTAEADTRLIRGRAGDDLIDGGDQDLKARGGKGNDTIFGGAGNDTIVGGAGYDTAVFSGSVLGYSWTQNKNGTWTVTGQDGTDTLRKIEALKFDDYTLSIDGANNLVYARADTAATDEETGVTVSALANDLDFDGDALTVTGASSTTAGVTVTVNPDNTVSYKPGAAFQHLAAGETATDTVTYTVDDGRGGTVSSTLTVTITGLNDAPVTGAADLEGAVQELGAGDPGANVATLTDSGVIAFTDVDLSDGHTVSVDDGAANYLGSFTASVSDAATGDGSGAVTWTFSVDDAALNFLQAGETLIQSYAVTVDDGKGGTATETVTVTITGAADPVANPGAGTVLDFDSGTNTITYSDGYNQQGVYQQDGYTLSWYRYDNSGSIGQPFPDIDGSGDAEFGNGPIPGGAYGYSYIYGYLTSDAGARFSVTDFDMINDGGGDYFGQVFFQASETSSVAYAYKYDNGQEQWETYTYDYNTGQYTYTSTATQAEAAAVLSNATQLFFQVYSYDFGSGSVGDGIGIDNIRIVPGNAPPAIGAAVLTGAVQELAEDAPGAGSAVHTASGEIAFSDANLGDSHTVSVTDARAGYLGQFTASITDPASGDGSGKVSWSFTVDDAALDFLRAGRTLVQSYAVTIDDGMGGKATETVRVTLTGAADANEPPATIIDFDTGTNTVTSVSGQNQWGTYSEKGVSLRWEAGTYDNSSPLPANALQDVDGDGDLEFGPGYQPAQGTGYNGYSLGWLSMDNGDRFSVSDFDLVNDDGDSGLVTYFSASNENKGVFAYKADNGLDQWSLDVWYFDSSHPQAGEGYSTATATKAEVANACSDLTSFLMVVTNWYGNHYGNGFGIDNLQVA